MGSPPGTVSKILWHFTGGPRWNEESKCQQLDPKPPEEAYRALLSILEGTELRLGQYREVAKVEVTKRARGGSKAGGAEGMTRCIFEHTSSPVCCLADIPVGHLSYQAEGTGGSLLDSIATLR